MCLAAKQGWRRVCLCGGVLMLLAMLGACAQPCTQNRDCEQGRYCTLRGDGSGGVCQQDCNDLFACPEGSVCSISGQCQLIPRTPEIYIDAPATSVQGDPGDRFELRGHAVFLGQNASLRIERQDFRGCDPMTPIELLLEGQADREIGVPFVVPDLRLPDGGGLLRVSVEVHRLRAETSLALAAGQLCSTCPTVTLQQPSSGPLPQRVLFSHIAGRVVSDGTLSLRWHVAVEGLGDLSAPLHLTESGAFALPLLPLFVGANLIEVEASNSNGMTRCRRRIRTQGVTADRLQVSLGWSSGEADLDLHLVAPGGNYGLGDCSPAIAAERRFESCEASDDQQAYGPETLVITNSGAAGSYGILVVGYGGAPGELVASYVRVLSQGQQILALGPRDLDASQGEIWTVGTVTVGELGGVSSTLLIDRIDNQAPSGSPETWLP